MALTAKKIVPWETIQVFVNDFRLMFSTKVLLFGDVIYDKTNKVVRMPFPFYIGKSKTLFYEKLTTKIIG